MRLKLLSSFFVFLSLGQILNAQCQNQYCTWDGSCWKCSSGSTYYCSPKLARCPEECTEGHCSGTLAGAARAVSLKDDLALDENLQDKGVSSKNAPQAEVRVGPLKEGALQGAEIIESTHSNADLLKKAVLENTGKEAISAYQLGYVVNFREPNRKPEVHLLDAVSLSEPLQPGKQAQVPEQNVPPSLLRSGASTIEFFVAEISFVSGSSARANIEDVITRSSK